MKTKPMQHQLIGLDFLFRNFSYAALGAEQGTGKTWMLLADAERAFNAGMIQGLLVIAPKGVHTNWVRREIPMHLEAPCQAEYWLSGAGAKKRAKIDRLLRMDPGEKLAVLIMNVDAVNTNDGHALCQKFLSTFKTMMVIDESQRIKNPSAKRTKRILALRERAVSRRIASGTLVANTPMDLFGQYEFLRPGLLGTTSYRAFVAQYAQLLPDHHPLVAEIRSRTRGGPSPQVIKRDQQGQPQYQNLDRLRALMGRVTYRVLKRDCLDLPEKIYQTLYFELIPSQRRLYKQLSEDKSYVRDDGDIDIFNALTLIGKLRQVTSGFIMVDGQAQRLDLDAAAPRMELLLSVVEDCDEQIVVWAAYREEIEQISRALAEYGKVVQYHGGTSNADREHAVDAFQRGEARFFVSNQSAGGTGLTLTAGTTVVYYSNTQSLEERLQSEDRCHRIGTKTNVRYIDLVAEETVDERIAHSLQSKQFVASYILDGG